MKNLIQVLKYQGPPKRFIRNFILSKTGWGIFSKHSHVNQHTNKDKVSYPRYESAERAATAMGKKTGKHFSIYKCLYCDGFHIGKNKNNK